MENNVENISSTEYSEILRMYGIQAIANEPYWQVGSSELVQGWIIHVSVILSQVKSLLELVIPKMIEWQVPFKIIMSQDKAGQLIEGGMGFTQLGKIITVHPQSDGQTIDIANELIKLTSSFRGPAIPTDRHLGGIVYTRYGSHNPIIGHSETGRTFSCIYDAKGEIIVDPYNIPFKLPEGIAWPYSTIAATYPPAETKLLNGRYYPLTVIKPDAKGRVIRGIYFQKPWRICSCIIKEGKANMFSDNFGRDIQDRLNWQYDLYQDLKDHVPMPKIFDRFKIGDRLYLTMEYINGDSLTNWIFKIYDNRTWHQLSREDQIKLSTKLLSIIEILHRLHEKGYVHRDLTPDNFLLNKQEELYLIDLELAWSRTRKFPLPPFRLGTPGYMSPEQEAGDIPTIKEDIYGLGALMVTIFTNLHAVKVSQQTSHEIEDLVIFLTQNTSLSVIISRCLNENPGERPSLYEIKQIIEHELHCNETVKPSIEAATVAAKSPEDIVKGGLLKLASPSFQNGKQRWVTLSNRVDAHIGNEQSAFLLSDSWQSGMTGLIWLVSKAHRLNFSTDVLEEPFHQSWDYLNNHFFPNIENKPPGLYDGAAGVAIALCESVEAKLVQNDSSVEERLRACFSKTSDSLSLSTGIAGQGLALLKASSILSQSFFEDTLKNYIDKLLASQLPDGGWEMSPGLKRKHQPTGLAHGIAGMVWFLLHYAAIYKDGKVEASIRGGITWLKNVRHYKEGVYYWSMLAGNRIEALWELNTGSIGIALVFIKAYKLYGEQSYKQIAEETLYRIPNEAAMLDWTFESGLSGLGEVYLDAYRTFENPEWKRRSDWIVKFLQRCASRSKKELSWIARWNSMVSPNLFSGIGGILHYFMRLSDEDQSNLLSI